MPLSVFLLTFVEGNRSGGFLTILKPNEIFLSAISTARQLTEPFSKCFDRTTKRKKNRINEISAVEMEETHFVNDDEYRSITKRFANRLRMTARLI